MDSERGTELYDFNNRVGDEPVFVDHVCACIKRIPTQDDVRSNLHQGRSAIATGLTDKYQRIIDVVRPKIKRDNMYFVGLDIVGGNLIEININCAGGMGKANEVHDVNFAVPVVDYLEKKMALDRISAWQE